MSHPEDFRRDTNITALPGTIVAEFSCGQQALSFAKQYGYVVTAGINHHFAVRVPIESAAVSQPGTDSSRPVPALPLGTGRGFQLIAFTPKGRQAIPEVAATLEEWFGSNELSY